MTEQEIFEKIKQILSEENHIQADITLDTDLVHKIGLDSLDAMILLNSIQNKFNISISSSEQDELQKIFTKTPTVQTLVNMVAKKIGKQENVDFISQSVTIPGSQSVVEINSATQSTERPVKKNVFNKKVIFDIPNTEYVTVKKGLNNEIEIFVGDSEPARYCYYRGSCVWYADEIKEYFEDIQKLNPKVCELHVLCSSTPGETGTIGKPSQKHGPNEWVRVRFDTGDVGPWVFYHQFVITLREPLEYHTCLCVFHCARGVANDDRLWSVFCNETPDKSFAEQPVLEVAQKTVQEPIIETKHTIPIVEKPAPNKKTKCTGNRSVVIYLYNLLDHIKKATLFKKENSK